VPVTLLGCYLAYLQREKVLTTTQDASGTSTLINLS